jgi:prepilin-type N-terminal cleavage/methylation domain-containing protein
MFSERAWPQDAGCDDGFSLLELLVAISIASMFLATIALSLHTFQVAVQQPMVQAADEMAMDALEQQLRADASVATLITATASTVQFAHVDAQHQWQQWSYSLNGGMVRTNSSGSTVLDDRVSVLSARFIPADQLSQNGQLAAPIYGVLGSPKRQTMTVEGQTITNGVVEMQVTRGSISRTIHLMAGVTPTTFGIENGPVWHAVLSRTSTTKRIAFVGQKTFYTIHGTVTYSYDNWATSHQWCQYAIHDGLRDGDPVAEMAQPDALESSTAIFSTCQQLTKKHELPMQLLPNTVTQ